MLPFHARTPVEAELQMHIRKIITRKVLMVTLNGVETRTLIKHQGSRIGWSLANTLDLMKKSLQRLLAAIEGAGRRVSARVLQENAHEKGHVEQQCITYCSHRKPHFCRHHLKTIVDIVVTTSIIFLLSYPNKSAKTTR